MVFGAWVDGNKVFESDVMHRGDAPKLVSLDLSNARKLVLAVVDANDGTAGDNANWGGAAVIAKPGAQGQIKVVPAAQETAPQIAPSRTSAPMINYPRITGATPGRPFLFRIPASGAGELTFSAKNLPAGLVLDAKTGIITGSLQKDGRTDVQVSVKAADGKMANTVITIVGGKDVLALTPPLGWNSWNVWGGNVTADHVRAAADGMVKSGLAGQGYTYVNIDDAWEAGWHTGPNGTNDVAAGRDAGGEILTNEKFPDMKGLVDYVHARGLKAGIYTGPGLATCQGLAASYQHEEQDARTYAKWGFDYLKYDWCRYPVQANTNSPLDVLQKPYILMRGVLDKLDRDVVFSLCQYGWGKVWEWGGGSAATCGASSATSPTRGCRCRRSASSRRATRSSPGRVTGTTPTCSSSAISDGVASTRRGRRTSRRTSRSPTSRSGRCRQRRSSSAPTCRRSTSGRSTCSATARCSPSTRIRSAGPPDACGPTTGRRCGRVRSPTAPWRSVSSTADRRRCP